MIAPPTGPAACCRMAPEVTFHTSPRGERDSVRGVSLLPVLPVSPRSRAVSTASGTGKWAGGGDPQHFGRNGFATRAARCVWW